MKHPIPPDRSVDKLCLAFDPWGDGKGDDHYRVFWDEMIKAIWLHPCDICRGWIKPGDRHRAQGQLNLDGSKQCRTFRFCGKCCVAMAASWSDEGRAIGERYAIGQKRIDDHGYAPDGGGFNNALSRLRTLELISGRGDIKASDDLFE